MKPTPSFCDPAIALETCALCHRMGWDQTDIDILLGAPRAWELVQTEPVRAASRITLAQALDCGLLVPLDAPGFRVALRRHGIQTRTYATATFMGSCFGHTTSALDKCRACLRLAAVLRDKCFESRMVAGAIVQCACSFVIGRDRHRHGILRLATESLNYLRGVRH